VAEVLIFSHVLFIAQLFTFVMCSQSWKSQDFNVIIDQLEVDYHLIRFPLSTFMY